MATRREIEARKAALQDALRKECLNPLRRAGSLLPPIRELAERFQISALVVRQVIDSVENEGLLYAVPRVGTFIGRQDSASSEFYLLVIPQWAVEVEGYLRQVQAGFEQRIAVLGGASLLLTFDNEERYPQHFSVPPLAEVYVPTCRLRSGDI